MALNYISAQLKDAPRHASGPRCVCCNRPAAPDIDPEDYASWTDVVLGGFLYLTVCSICGKCPLAGPCRFDGDARDQARLTRGVAR